MASIRKVGVKWRAEVYINGVRKAKRHATKREAQQWAANMEAELQLLADGVSTTHTLGDLFMRYSDEVSETKAGSRWEAIRLQAFLRYDISKIKLIDLRRSDLDKWIQGRLETVKTSTVNRELNLISHCFTEASRWGWMKHNPMENLKRPRNPPARDRLISQDEIDQILIALNYDEEWPVEQAQQRVAVAFLFAIETGMRAGEICMLDKTLVDVKKKVAHLPRTKNGYPRDVPLSDEAIRLWRRLPEKSFKIASGTLSTLFRKAVGKTTIENLTFHDTRHEAITRLSKKLNVLGLAKAVGHRDIKQLQTYYNESAEDLAKLL
jgi:integrase